VSAAGYAIRALVRVLTSPVQLPDLPGELAACTGTGQRRPQIGDKPVELSRSSNRQLAMFRLMRSERAHRPVPAPAKTGLRAHTPVPARQRRRQLHIHLMRTDPATAPGILATCLPGHRNSSQA
jgi:hypothetical protein